MAAEQTPLYRYPGTKPFEAGDYALFKGRDEDIIKLFDLVFIENPVVLFSRSGLGKSSLLNAGLYNKIINENKSTPLFIRFGACFKDTTILPLEKLTEVINKEKIQEQNSLFEKLVSPVNDKQYSLWYRFKNIQINDPAKNSFVLIFDQFEELLPTLSMQSTSLKKNSPNYYILKCRRNCVTLLMKGGKPIQIL